MIRLNEVINWIAYMLILVLLFSLGHVFDNAYKWAEKPSVKIVKGKTREIYSKGQKYTIVGPDTLKKGENEYPGFKIVGDRLFIEGEESILMLDK